MLEGIEPKFGGIYVCMEGPQFSSYAESMTYKQLGYSVIDQHARPRRAKPRCDGGHGDRFDCWHPDHDAVTVQDIIKVLVDNADRAKKLVARLARDFPREHEAFSIGSDRALEGHRADHRAGSTRPRIAEKLDVAGGF